jgi:hypothetical protein
MRRTAIRREVTMETISEKAARLRKTLRIQYGIKNERDLDKAIAQSPVDVSLMVVSTKTRTA